MTQSKLIIDTFKHWLQTDLIDPKLSDEDKAKALYEAPFVVVSHNTAEAPIFNYANLAAQSLWELSWDEFTQLPSSKSAEATLRESREKVLNSLNQSGYCNHYRGTRISSTGKRFDIIDTCIWNMYDKNGIYCGQAACFVNWEYLDE